MKTMTAALGGLLVILAACAQEPPPSVSINRVLSPKIVMDVKIISLVDRSGIQPSNSPYNGNNFSPTIMESIKQWSVDRLQANGQSGQAVVLVKRATLTAEPLPVKTGIEGWFTRDQSMKYVGQAEVSIEANGQRGFAVADATATRSVSLPENPTELEKQNAYATLLNGLMKDLGDNIEMSIRAHMSSFVMAPPVYGATAVPVAVPYEAQK
ncbi:MAG: hypothetical protein WC464_03590 [Bdellovibrionales bacterium]